MKKNLLLFLTILGFSFSLSGEEIIQDQSNLHILSPALKNRETEKIRLGNGLEVYLISDPDTPESGAALAVHAGTWDDPEHRPGMAHFVEHMLFLGNEKYPNESGYSRFLDEHGGKRNAFTTSDRTVFMFSVENGSFNEALDRFAQFFISPLFNPSGVARELMAIDQEFSKNLMIEFWRTLHVTKELANPLHPFHRFDIGNAETLKSISREELINWVNTHYTADRMHLAIISKLPLRALRQEVSQIFSLIEKRNVSFSEPKQPLFSSKTENALVVVRPLHETRSLSLGWELPIEYGRDQEIKAERLISYVLGHEGETSLLAKLKKKGLALGLSVHQFQAGKHQSILTISIELTDMGVANTYEVIEDCHKALTTLRAYGIPRYIFDETKQIAELSYLFQNRGNVFDEVSEYAYHLVDEDLTTFPLKSLMPTRYDPNKVKELLSFLIPENSRYTLVAPLVEGDWKQEMWMGVDYALLPISKQTLEKWESVNIDEMIALPPPNRFLPEQLLCQEKATQNLPLLPKPYIAIDNKQGKLYVCPDDRFGIPKIAWDLTIHSPAFCEADPQAATIADLFCAVVKHRLNPTTYEAELGGLKFTLAPSHHGISLKVRGYHQKAQAFLNKILATLTAMKPTQEEMLLFREHLRREYHNLGNSNPLKQSSELLHNLLYKNYAGPLEKLAALDEISFDDLKNFSEVVFDKTYIEGILFGDLSQEEVSYFWDQITDTLVKENYPPHEHPKVELAELSQLSAPSFLVKESSLEGNALILAIDCGSFNFQKEAALDVLTKGLEEPFFSELRTKQQTAYLVGNWSKEMERRLYAFFAIQSSSHTTRDLLSRFELFFEDSLMHLHRSVINEQRFLTIKQSLITQLQTPPRSPASMSHLLNGLAFEYEGDFAWIEKKIEALETLSYEDFIAYSKEFLGKTNAKRIAVCVDGRLAEKGALSYRKITSFQTLLNEICYKPKNAG